MKVLLYSGGTDSWLINKLWKPDVKIYVNMNSKYSSEEIQRLQSDVKIVDFNFLGETEKEDAYIPLRNLYLLMIASNFGDEICIGCNIEDRLGNDASKEFLDKAEELLNSCLREKIKICKDYCNMTKSEMLKKYIEEGGELKEYINSTFTCYRPVNGKECGKCKACIRKKDTIKNIKKQLIKGDIHNEED